MSKKTIYLTGSQVFLLATVRENRKAAFPTPSGGILSAFVLDRVFNSGNTMNDSQKLLADYVQRGSEPAFTELVQSYLNFVYATALRLTDGDTHLAEDVTQTVFADLARSARSLSKNVLLGGWLHRHACFVAAKIMRSERRRQSRERHAAAMNTPQDHDAGRIAELAPELDDAINQLSDDDRVAILLRFFEQRDFCGVGAGLGASEEAARKRVSRAVEKLHAVLTRRGLTLSAAGLGAALGAGLVSKAPAGMAAEIAASALAAAASGQAAIGLSVLTAGKIKLAVLAAAFAAAVATPVYIAHQSQLALREENRALQARVAHLTALQAEKAGVAAPRALPALVPSASAEHHELLRLRGEMGVLRDQLAKANQANAGGARPTEVAAPTEPADISVSFPSIPMMQLIDMFQNWSGKALTIAPEVALNKTIWLKAPTGVPLTKTQAMHWTEEALKDQGRVVIRTNDDGSLLVVPAPNP
jgi:RNA polymerase sigma factor (sigma-70 family)